MEKVSRKENKLLNRVEISFRWHHEGKATPSRKAVMDLVKTLEPGAKENRIVVKECSTRFGQALTTGLAFIYGDEESMKVEPAYIHKQHEQFHSSSDAPAKKEAPAEETPAVEGGDQ